MSREIRKSWGGKEDGLRAVITIETACVMPVLFLVIYLSILGTFYYHDKHIVISCAWEAAVVGSTKAREEDGVTEDTVAAVFAERIRGKCILFGEVEGKAAVSDESIVLEASAARGGMRLSASVKAAVTHPEDEIRKIRNIGTWLP